MDIKILSRPELDRTDFIGFFVLDKRVWRCDYQLTHNSGVKESQVKAKMISVIEASIKDSRSAYLAQKSTPTPASELDVSVQKWVEQGFVPRPDLE